MTVFPVHRSPLVGIAPMCLLMALGCAFDEPGASVMPIVDGTPSTNASAVYVYMNAGPGYTCGGTVVGPRHVLTGKNCVTDHPGGRFAPVAWMRVYTGENPLRGVGTEHLVESIITDGTLPSMGSLTDNDLAILVTYDPIGVPVVPMAGTGAQAGDELRVNGYFDHTLAPAPRRAATMFVDSVDRGRLVIAAGGNAFCTTDYGAGALDGSGAVAGVALMVLGDSCGSDGGLLIDVSAHRAWLEENLPGATTTTDAGGGATVDAGRTTPPDGGAPFPDGSAGSDAGNGGTMPPAAGCAVSGSSGPSGLAFLGLGLMGALLWARRRA